MTLYYLFLFQILVTVSNPNNAHEHIRNVSRIFGASLDVTVQYITNPEDKRNPIPPNRRLEEQDASSLESRDFRNSNTLFMILQVLHLS